MDPKQQSSRLSGAHLRLFMSVLLQNETVFQQFYGKLTVDKFSDESHKLLYRVLLDLWEKNKTVPSEAELYVEIESHFSVDSQIISSAGRDDLEDLLNYSYDEATFGSNDPSSSKMTKFAFSAGKRFLQQCHATEVLSDLSSMPTLDNLSGFFNQAASQAELLALNEYNSKPKLTLPEEWSYTSPFILRTTGIPFLDKYMRGGARKQEGYSLMAPYGTCKTTLAVMLWSQAAMQSHEDTLQDDWDGNKGLSFLVTYEAPLSPEVQHRVVMYTAQVHRERLEAMGIGGIGVLGYDPENPLPYEQKLFSQQIGDGLFEPEKARIERVTPYLNEHTVCLDFTGDDDEWPNAGHGGIDEIIQRINLELRSRGPEYYVKNVIVDYLGMMVDQDNSIVGDKHENHLLYQQKVSELVNRIAVRMDCHIWILHQLSGAANAMLSPTKTMHHTDAKGSKSLVENIHFSFVIGNLNMDQMGQIACTKVRGARRQPPSLITVEGEFNNVFAPENYHIDSKGKIVDKETAKAVGNSLSLGDFDSLGDTTDGDVAAAAEGDDG